MQQRRYIKKTPITAESLRFLILFMLMVLALQLFALLLASNVVRPDMIIMATPQPLYYGGKPLVQPTHSTWLGNHNITFIQRPSIKIPIITRFKTVPW